MLDINTTVIKMVAKGQIPEHIYKNISKSLIKVDETKNIKLYDIKRIKGDYSKAYYRIRKDKYRAIFYFENDNTMLDFIGKREDIYKLWKP